ncbi:MAG: hypothetical protein AAGJ81_05485 [Verrucomicrobiota bacterium]
MIGTSIHSPSRRGESGLGAKVVFLQIIFAISTEWIRIRFVLCSLLVVGGALGSLSASDEPELPSGPLRFLSSGTMDYDFSTDTISATGPVEAAYGPYRMEAGEVVWNRGEGLILLRGGMVLDNLEAEFVDPDLQGRGDFFEAWWPRSYGDAPFILEAHRGSLGIADRSIQADGRVAARFPRGRMIAEKLDVVATEEGSLAAEGVAAGSGVFLLEADSVSGDVVGATLTDATVYLSEPSDWGPRISAREIRHARGKEYISLYGVTLGVGPVPILYLPRAWLRDWDLGIRFDLGGGFSDNLGTYAEIGLGFSVSPTFYLMPEVSLYSKRGVMLSPNFSWQRSSESGEYYTSGSLFSGYISDRGGSSLRGVDRFGDPIGSSRGYALAQGLGNRRGSWSFVNQFEARSDTEVLRDFRPGLESRYFAPDSFSEVFVPFGPFSFSALGRFRTLDMTESIEAIPSVSVALNPLPLGKTDIVQEGWLGYGRLRRADSDNSTEAEADRLEAAYRLSTVLPTASWVTIEPVAGVRQRVYENFSGSTTGSEGSSTLFEVGFDAGLDFNRRWDTKSRVWNVDGLLHQTRPVLGYRYLPLSGLAVDEIPQIQPDVYTSGVDPLGFTNLIYRSDPGAEQILRVGWENRILAGTYGEPGQLRALGAISVYQDWIEGRSEGSSRPNNSMVVASAKPASWVSFDLFTRLDTNRLTLTELVPGLALRDGDRWDSRWYFQSLQRQVNQLLWDASIAFNRKNRFLFEMRYNGQSQKITKQSYGWRRRVGNAWELETRVIFRRDDTRESDFQFNVSVTSLLF